MDPILLPEHKPPKPWSRMSPQEIVTYCDNLQTLAKCWYETFDNLEQFAANEFIRAVRASEADKDNSEFWEGYAGCAWKMLQAMKSPKYIKTNERLRGE